MRRHHEEVAVLLPLLPTVLSLAASVAAGVGTWIAVKKNGGRQ